MLHFLPLGIVLYFFPDVLALTLGVHPLWLARLSGAALSAWGVLLAAAPRWPDSLVRYGMVAVNLLTVATLLPAVLRGAEPKLPLLVACVLLGCSAAAGILAKDVDGQ